MFKLFREIKRCVGLSRTYWGRDDSDWSTVTGLMEHQLTLQGNIIANDTWHKYAKKDARRIKICVELLRRINNEFDIGAFDQAQKRYPSYGPHWAKQINILEAQQEEMFFRYFRHFRSWWT